MTTPFSNPITGAQGSLVRAQIKSPNFSLGPPITGWSIDKNGNAFFSGTFGGSNWILNSTGFFLYSGTPAIGNLVLSSIGSALPILDPVGNTAQPGTVSYHAGSWVQLDGAELVFNGGASISQAGVGGVGMFFGGTPGTNTLQSSVPIVNGWNAVEPGTLAALETWHLISTGFPAGWGNNATGNTHGVGYRFLSEAAGLVFLDIQLTIAAATVITNGEVIATLPAGWRPLNDTAITVPIFLNGAAGNTNTQLQVNTNGTITWSAAGITTPAGGGSAIFGVAIIQIAV